MKISYNWLKEFVDFQQDPQELSKILDSLGLGVDSINSVGSEWTEVVVGKVETCESIPMTVHLSYCEVDVGKRENLPIVCGAPNVAAGLTVPVALVGAKLPDGFTIDKIVLKGVVSEGMICSEKELGLSHETSGILVLPDNLPVGSPLEEHFGAKDWIFDLEVTFNRPDCLSHLGVAREIAASLKKAIRMPEISFRESEIETSSRIKVNIENAEKCPRYSARIIEDVEIKPSPLWLQERLRNLGIRPINNIVDVTNYVLLETGHPLHAFDYHLISEDGIIIRLAEPNEKFITLDEKEHKLSKSDLLIADKDHGIALAGIMGGFNTEINDNTKDVLIECACFEPTGIRISTRDLSISTESSHRFERGVDPEGIIFATNRTVELMRKFGGGSILKGVVDEYPGKWKKRSIEFRSARANKILGTKIKTTTMVSYLEGLGCEVDKSNKMTVSPPSFRNDLQREIDLIEEIARLYGYENINTSKKSAVSLIPKPNAESERLLINRFKSVLLELGLTEAITYSLIPSQDKDWFKFDNEPVKLINPLSDDMSLLRPCLGPTLLRTAQRNWNAGTKDIRLFEWGKCFWLENDKICEDWRLGGVIIGDAFPKSWILKSRNFSIYDLMGLLEGFGCRISLDKFEFIPYHIPEYFQTGGVISLKKNRNPVIFGHFGQIEPDVAKHYDLDIAVWFFELNGSLLLKNSGRTPGFQPLPRFPAALRDLSFVVDKEITAGQLKEMILKSGGELLIEVELFDLFTGGSIPGGKKSLAFHLIFRSVERTLSDAEIEESTDRIISTVETNTGAVLRSL